MLKRYLANLRAVQGWLHPFSARFIGEIGGVQRRAGIVGGSVEIGIHHGKLFLVLQNTCPGPALAIDLFEAQHLNVDRSGKGSRARFEANVAKWGDPRRLQVIAGSSLDLTASDIRKIVGEAALFSVDGGHTAECTVSDLRLAEGSLAERGVVVIDDVFNESWPDVGTGFAHYMRDGGLKPFAITPNKVYLARPAAIPFYRAELSTLFGPFLEKRSECFGNPVDVYYVEGALRPIETAVKKSPAYLALRDLKRATIGRRAVA